MKTVINIFCCLVMKGFKYSCTHVPQILHIHTSCGRSRIPKRVGARFRPNFRVVTKKKVITKKEQGVDTGSFHCDD